jgi:hypothetical protein
MLTIGVAVVKVCLLCGIGVILRLWLLLISKGLGVVGLDLGTNLSINLLIGRIKKILASFSAELQECNDINVDLNIMNLVSCLQWHGP